MTRSRSASPATGGDGQRPVRVLHSFGDPKPTTNPYLLMLVESLTETGQCEVIYRTWGKSFFGRYDIFHVHWPEVLTGGRVLVARLGRQSLFLLLLLRLWVTGTPIVRTVHNVDMPQGISAVERALIRLCDRLTTYRIRLNEHTDIAAGPFATIPIGHYRNWYAAYVDPAIGSIRGRFTYFGLIRRYKSVDTLVRAFREIDSDEVSLTVGGNPSTEALASGLREIAGDDRRIEFLFSFLPDEELVQITLRSELVVMPYRNMHNSSGVLTGLSLDRPVLAPDNEVNVSMQQEVGEGWLLLYPGELTSEVLEAALAQVRHPGRSDSPDLSAREWPEIGKAHIVAYREALRAIGRGPGHLLRRIPVSIRRAFGSLRRR